MSRGEVAIVVAVIVGAIGAGLFHPGLGLLVIAAGLGAWGVVTLRFPETPETMHSPGALDALRTASSVDEEAA